jgi:hypothetical protein
MTRPRDEDLMFDPVAAILAWVVPGLGHIIIGERTRGIVLLIAIHLMMATGLLIGGIDVVDSRADRWWYLGQVLAGPIPIAVDRHHQSLKVTTRGLPDHPPPSASSPYEPSLARVNEIGTLFVTLAGMLNLMCILDVVQHPKPSPAERRERLRKSKGVVGTMEARER